jgi:Xaa-Pro aminopeptidase
MLPRIIESLREIKSDSETALIRLAVRAQKKAYALWRKELKIGMSELDAAALLRYLMVSRFGAQDESFKTIVAFDENSSMPHYEPGAKRLGKNSLVLVDWGATVGQYHSDMTRTFFVGKPNRELERIYGIVSNAQALAIAAVKTGVVASAVDAVARDYIRDSGYGDRFGHSLGHGIGLAVHEGPTLSVKSETVLEPGHIVTVEPGIYVPGLGGVRIEDGIIVTPTGGRVIDG